MLNLGESIPVPTHAYIPACIIIVDRAASLRSIIITARVHKKEERRLSSCLKAVFEVQRSPGILLCSSCDNTLSSCNAKHSASALLYFKKSFYRQVYWS